MSKTVPRQIDLCVVSAGGVATSQLLSYLDGRIAVNSMTDADNLKHLPVPPVSFNPDFKIIYIFGDPVNAVLSLFRRRYQVMQSRKLLRGINALRMPRGMNVKKYVAIGSDLFGFERHFDNYYERHLIHPTLFLRYETLWENLDAVRDFLGPQAEALGEFFPRCARKSTEELPPPKVMEQLREIYRPFTERLAALPDSFVRGAHLAHRRSHLFFSTNLRLATMNALKARLGPAGALYGE